MERIILHVDVNNAFLSWTAVNMLENGYGNDIRETISIIGGDEDNRSGIVLAKSDKAKKIGIKTGDTIYETRIKCPHIEVYLPTSKVYKMYSEKLYNLLYEYSDKIERYSVDECFLDITRSLMGRTKEEIAKEIQRRTKEELGFTVNIGISDCKVLAKMASDFSKPNKIHTLYRDEISYKIWHLPIAELFMVGKKSVPKLLNMQIKTIGDLAKRNKADIVQIFGKHGAMMWEYANGIDISDVSKKEPQNKSISKEYTLSEDTNDLEKLENITYQAVEHLANKLRAQNMVTSTVSVQLKSSEFTNNSHQRKLNVKTNLTKEIYVVAKILLNEIYSKDKQIRLIGVRLGDVEVEKSDMQISMFDIQKDEKQEAIDNVMDQIKKKFGEGTITRAKRI